MMYNTAAELARYYLMSHGAVCDEIDKYERWRECWFRFMLYGCKFKLGVYNVSIDIRPDPGCWFNIDLKCHSIDETNPEFDPEEFFKPFLTRIKEMT